MNEQRGMSAEELARDVAEALRGKVKVRVVSVAPGEVWGQVPVIYDDEHFSSDSDTSRIVKRGEE